MSHKLTPPQKQALKNFLKYRLQMNKEENQRARAVRQLRREYGK